MRRNDGGGENGREGNQVLKRWRVVGYTRLPAGSRCVWPHLRHGNRRLRCLLHPSTATAENPFESLAVFLAAPLDSTLPIEVSFHSSFFS